jgi:enoyl-CoA hydratase/carnithine racemase
VVDSDVVIASSDATFLDPHVSVGQASAFETIGLARRAAFGPVARMALIGAHERVDARRAYQLGWVSEVVDPPERLTEVAADIAQRIADSADAVTLAALKKQLWASLETTRARVARGQAAEPLTEEVP